MNRKEKTICVQLAKPFTFFLAVFPVLATYGIQIGGIILSVPDVVLILLFPLLLLALLLKRTIVVDKVILYLFFFVFLHFVVFVHRLDCLVDTAHFLLVLFVLSIIQPNIYDRQFGAKCIIIISIFSSSYLIFQFICLRGLGVYIPGQLNILNAHFAATGAYRPFSIFSEPSAFGTYNAVGLATVLACDSYSEKKQMFVALYLSLASLLVMSTTAIGLMLLVWLRWIQANGMKKIKWIVLACVFALPVLFYLGISFGIFEEIYYHSFEGLFSGDYAPGLNGRIGAVGEAITYNIKKGIVPILFGTGMSDVFFDIIGFIPTIGRINVFFGYTGYIVFILFYMALFRNYNQFSRTVLLLAVAAGFFAESLFGIGLLWFLPIAQAWKNDDRITINMMN